MSNSEPVAAKVLMVDDEPAVLDGFRRNLRAFNLDIASSGEEALQLLAERGPYGIIVADLQMPTMDGIELLAKVRKLSPDTTRMMLTGNSEQKKAVQAVNEGALFRFLNKPCPAETLEAAIREGLEHYRLVTAERQLLSQTLTSAIKILTEILAIVNPTAFGRAFRIRPLAVRIADRVGVERTWEIEIAAMLCQLGCLSLAEQTLDKAAYRNRLSAEESYTLTTHPQVGYDLISQVPRLHNVARIIYYQEKCFNGSGFPDEGSSGDDIPLGARILKVALDFDLLVSNRNSSQGALHKMQERPGYYDPRVLAALCDVLRFEPYKIQRQVDVHNLPVGSVLAEPIVSIEGTVLVGEGHEITDTLRLRLIAQARASGIQEPICVWTPI